MSDSCKEATKYAVRIAECKSLDDLRHLWEEININMKNVEGWYRWLIDIKDSQKQTLAEEYLDEL